MQKALENNVAKQKEQRATLHARHNELQKIHQQIQEDDQVKATLLHNVTNRMIEPSEFINSSVTILKDNCQDITLPEVNKEIANIKQQSETILELLSHKFDVNTGKEVSHE
jgi:methyl-accepting chemotaxis protein/sigma-B regulation protein RsbU (phosphoserine phosphatase)